MKTILFSAAAAMLIGAPASARTIVLTTNVEVGDLDLSQDEGVELLEQRIRQAVKTMCNSYERPDGFGSRPVLACIRAARIEPTVELLVAQARNDQAGPASSVIAVNRR